MRISDWSSDVCSSDLEVAISAVIGIVEKAVDNSGKHIGSAAELDLGIARKAGERITRRRIVYQPPPALKVGRRRRPGKPGGIPCGAGSAPGIWQVCRQCMADAFDLGISFVEPAQVLVDRLVAEKRRQHSEEERKSKSMKS